LAWNAKAKYRERIREELSVRFNTLWLVCRETKWDLPIFTSLSAARHRNTKQKWKGNIFKTLLLLHCEV
jgi:hypothetical protein